MTKALYIVGVLLENNGFYKLGLLSQQLDQAGWQHVDTDVENRKVILIRGDVTLTTFTPENSTSVDNILVHFTLTGRNGSRDLKIRFQNTTNLNSVQKQIDLAASSVQ
jgi:hypothetical protein